MGEKSDYRDPHFLLGPLRIPSNSWEDTHIGQGQIRPAHIWAQRT